LLFQATSKLEWLECGEKSRSFTKSRDSFRFRCLTARGKAKHQTHKKTLQQCKNIFMWINRQYNFMEDYHCEDEHPIASIDFLEYNLLQCWTGMVDIRSSKSLLSKLIEQNITNNDLNNNYDTLYMLISAFIELILQDESDINPYLTLKPYFSFIDKCSWSTIAPPSKYQRLFIDSTPIMSEHGLKEYYNNLHG